MTQNQTSASLVDPSWLAAHKDDPSVCLIEVAGLGQENFQAYKAGHIPNAHSWGWKETLWDTHRRDFPVPEEFARRLGAAGIDNDTTVVFYGEGIQFGIYAWWVFRYCGHRDVRILDGARRRWSAEGRPLATDEPPARPAKQYRPNARVEHMRILRDDVLHSLGTPHTVLLDGRSPEEYQGLRVGGPGGPDVGAMRYGRIPGAKHLFYEDFLNPDKSFKSPDALRAIVKERTAGDDENVIVYCRLAHRASVLYFTLTQLLGHERVRLYDGSWIEWGNLVGVPIER